MNSGTRFLSALVLTVPLVQGCASLFSLPSVEIVGVELVAVGLTEGLVEVTLDVANEGRRDMNLKGILYDLQVNTATEGEGWETLSNGFFEGPVSIQSKQTQRVKVPVPFEYRTVGEAVRAYLSRGEVAYRLTGEVWVGDTGVGIQVPFRTQGILGS